MSDTYDADLSAVGNSEVVSEGLTETPSVDLEPDSTPIETSFESSEDFVAESSEPVESLFEYEGTPITLDEARNGYLRQADYTRKTQELAEMRSRLAEAEAITAALQQDPIGTLEALQEAFGVSGGVQEDPFAGLDPDEARIVALEQKIAAQEQAATQAVIEEELSNLHGQFGDFDDSVLFAHAIKGGFPNLRSAYADMNFNSLQSQLEQLTAKQQEEEQRLAAKRQAANTVHNGSSRAGASVPAQPEKYGSLREAYLAAKKSLGV
jgi:hypothetical protein